MHEHYVMWSTIPLLVSYIHHRRIMVLGAALMGITGMVVSNDAHTAVRGTEKALFAIALASVYFGAALDIVVHNWCPRLPFRKEEDDPNDGVT